MRPRPGQSIAATYPKAPLRLPSRLRAKQRARTRSRRLKAKFHLGGIYHGQEQKANTGGRLEAIMRLPAPFATPSETAGCAHRIKCKDTRLIRPKANHARHCGVRLARACSFIRPAGRRIFRAGSRG